MKNPVVSFVLSFAVFGGLFLLLDLVIMQAQGLTLLFHN